MRVQSLHCGCFQRQKQDGALRLWQVLFIPPNLQRHRRYSAGLLTILQTNLFIITS